MDLSMHLYNALNKESLEELSKAVPNKVTVDSLRSMVDQFRCVGTHMVSSWP